MSALYDEYLAAAGLTVTQYALLVNVGRADGVSRTELAARLGMDRTTLTRNLGPLDRQGLLTESAGADKRSRKLRLSPAGVSKLEQSYPLWLEAQRAFVEKFGEQPLAQLSGLLRQASESVAQVRKAT